MDDADEPGLNPLISVNVEETVLGQGADTMAVATPLSSVLLPFDTNPSNTAILSTHLPVDTVVLDRSWV